MAARSQDNESNPKAKYGGLVTTLLFHAALIPIFIYFGFKPKDPPTPDPTEGIEVAFGDPFQGGPDLTPMGAPENPDNSLDKGEDLLFDPDGENSEPVGKNGENDNKVDPNNQFKKSDNSKGRGENEDPGNKGREDGKDGGNPEGDGYGIESRGVVFRPKIVRDQEDEGIVMVKVLIDSEGNVLKAEGGAKGTTSPSWVTIRKAEKKAKEYKFGKRPGAPNVYDFIKIDFRAL